MPLALPRAGSVVTYRGTQWTVEGEPWPGNRVTIRSANIRPPELFGHGTQTVSEVVNVAHLTVLSEPPGPVDELNLGPLRVVNQHGEPLTALQNGYQARAHIAGAGSLEILGAHLISGDESVLEVWEAAPGSDGSHETGVTIMSRCGVRGLSWLLRACRPGDGQLILKADGDPHAMWHSFPVTITP